MYLSSITILNLISEVPIIKMLMPSFARASDRAETPILNGEREAWQERQGDRPFLPDFPVLCELRLCLIVEGFKFLHAGYEGLDICSLPSALYANWATTALGFQMPGFASTDYVPFLPWIFLYLAGYFLWRLCPRDESGRLRLPRQKAWQVAAFVGRNCLPFYLVHQPVIYGVLSLAALLVGALG